MEAYVYKMSEDEFEQVVADAIDSMPDRVMDALDNVVIMMQLEPTPEQINSAPDDEYDEYGDVLGVYEGVSLMERADGYGYTDMPDMIVVFQGPHERCCDTREQMVEEVRKTIIHEIGHYFGFMDDALYEMGY